MRAAAPPPKPKARAGWSGEEEEDDFEGRKVRRRARAAADGYVFGDELVMEVRAWGHGRARAPGKKAREHWQRRPCSPAPPHAPAVANPLLVYAGAQVFFLVHVL